MTEKLNLQHDIDDLMHLLHLDVYTPQEAAEVLNISERLLLKAAYGGELRAVIINGDVVEVTRTDLLDWVKRRENL